jgi:sugar diacid utilization regulator
MEGRGVKERESPEAGSIALAHRLRRRRGEIERALAHICTAAGSGNASTSWVHVDDTPAAITEYYCVCIEKGEEAWSLTPPVAIEQARIAVRNGIALDDFLVRVMAVQTLLNEFTLQESRDLTGDSLSGAQVLQGSVLLRLTPELVREYKREEERLHQSSARRENAFVDRLLWGTPIAGHEIGYSLEMWHTGLVVDGTRAKDATRILAEVLGARLLAVSRDREAVWAWLGSHRRISSQAVRDALVKKRGAQARFAVGEPGRGLEGWRSTHFEARSALAVANRTSAGVTCFSQVALEAIALQTPDLARSLRAIYLAPLTETQRRGLVLRQTLRAYFEAGRNASSAAVSLRVSRRTVENRLRSVEQKLGRPLNACGAELELALRIEALDRN